MKKAWGALCVMLVMIMSTLLFGEIAEKKTEHTQEQLSSCYERKKRQPAQHKTTYFLGNLGYDAAMLFRNLFHWDSFKVIMTTFPFFIGARMIDEKLQNCFFDFDRKKNRNCPARWCRELARVSIGVPIGLLGTQAFLSHNDDMRITSQVFLLGMPFVLFSKDLIKKLNFEMCKRPRHEKFAPDQRCYGGCPSGHMAEAIFMAALYGKRFGPDLGVPLGIVAAFVGSVFLACNRHYVSQLVAGAGFGLLFALAADKVIDSKIARKQDLGFHFAVNDAGLPSIGFSLKF